MNKLTIIAMTALMIITGCTSGTYDYTPPSKLTEIKNSRVLSISKEEIWDHIIPNLSQSFFVVNNIARDSGFINVSYSGDPEKYVNCGTISASLDSDSYIFPAAIAYKEFATGLGGVTTHFRRKLHLNGRINISISDIDEGKSNIIVTTRYTLEKQLSTPGQYGIWNTGNEAISFSTNQWDVFDDGTSCRSTNSLENELFAIMDIDKYYAN